MRATQHSGRMGSAKHNDRSFDLDKANHIDQARMDENQYFCCYKNMSFEDAERRFYEEHFGEMISDINERAERSRHPERKTDPDKLIASKKTMPEEVIFQIGDKDTVQNVSAKDLTAVYNDFYKWHQDKFGDHVKTLDMALHADEKTPHIHMRRVWTYEHEQGFTAIGQHKALEQMGYELPDPTQAIGRNNNLKQVYTSECRNKWLDLCQQHGIEVEREPLHLAPNEQNLQKNDFIIQKQEQQLSQLQQQLDEKIPQAMRLMKEKQRVENEYKAIEHELQAKKQELADIPQQVEMAKAWYGDPGRIQGQVQELESQLNQKHQELSNTVQRAQALDRDVKTLEADKNTLEEQIKAKSNDLKAIEGRILTAKEVNNFKVKKSLLGGNRAVIEGTPEELASLKATAQKITYADERLRQANDIISRKDSIISEAQEQGNQIIKSAKDIDIKERLAIARTEIALKDKIKQYENVLKASPELQEAFGKVEHELQLRQQQHQSQSRNYCR